MNNNTNKINWDFTKKQLAEIGPAHNLSFQILEESEEELEFLLGGFQFSILAHESVESNSFDLIHWTSTYGGRFHPPEKVDELLVNEAPLHFCVFSAIMFVLSSNVRSAQDSMAEYEENLGKQIEEF